MEQKILSYSISLALCLLMFLPLRAQNGNPTVPPQGAPPKKEKKDANRKLRIWRRFPEFRSGRGRKPQEPLLPYCRTGIWLHGHLE